MPPHHPYLAEVSSEYYPIDQPLPLPPTITSTHITVNGNSFSREEYLLAYALWAHVRPSDAASRLSVDQIGQVALFHRGMVGALDCRGLLEDVCEKERRVGDGEGDESLLGGVWKAKAEESWKVWEGRDVEQDETMPLAIRTAGRDYSDLECRQVCALRTTLVSPTGSLLGYDIINEILEHMSDSQERLDCGALFEYVSRSTNSYCVDIIEDVGRARKWRDKAVEYFRAWLEDCYVAKTMPVTYEKLIKRGHIDDDGQLLWENGAEGQQSGELETEKMETEMVTQGVI